MDIFIVENGIAKPTEYILGIEPFKKIWERDKSEKKDKAMKDFTFIEYYTSPKITNPFRDIEESKREKKIIENIRMLKDYKPDKLVWEGVKKYKEMLFEWSISYRLYLAAKKAVENLRVFLENVDLNERNDKGVPIYKPKDVTTALNDISKIVDNLQQLERKLFDEITSAKIYGGEKKNPFEDPNIIKQTNE